MKQTVAQALLTTSPDRKQAWRWILPILFVLLFVTVVVWLPFQAQRMEASERQEQLIADTLWVEQALRFQLERDGESIRLMANDIAAGNLSEKQFVARAGPLIGSNRELHSILWLDAAGRVKAATAYDATTTAGISANSALAGEQARKGKTAYYSQPAPPPGMKEPLLMDYYVPMYAGSNYLGSLVARYKVATLLDEMVPWWFAQDNEILLTDNGDAVFARRAAGGPGRGVYTHQRMLDLPGTMLWLHTNSVKPGPKLLPNLLVGSVMALAVGLLWSLGALWRDITRRQAAEETLRKQQEKMQTSARLASMGEIASTLAHELNQPLAAISSYTAGALNLLHKEDGADKQLLKEALEKAGTQAQRAGQIIRSVHEFVKKREPKREPVTIAALIDGVQPLVELQARQHFVAIRTELAADLPPVLADRILLEQVLLNLTRNAIDAMQQTPAERRLLRITATLEEAEGRRNIIIAIADRGHGISADTAERLFSPFFSTKAQGMGMGLNICRSAIEFHGGSLNHVPNPEGGTIFRFTLPVMKEEICST
jgi:signal transduction histidine kinase